MSASPEPDNDASLWAEPPLSDLVLAEVIRQAEMHLEAQADRAYSSDARAMALMSAIVSAAIGVFGFALAMMQIDRYSIEAPVSFIVLGIFLTAAANRCFDAAKPIDFFSVGNKPVRLAPFMREVGGERMFGESYVRNLAERIDSNEKKIIDSASMVKDSVRLVLLGLWCGFLSYFVLFLVKIVREYYMDFSRF
jgi:H+/Cl- antiporter ClcA